MRAKSTIVLTPGDAPLAQLSDVIDDDDRSAKELWDAIARTYTASNAQAIINLEQELENLSFDEKNTWEKHPHKFHGVLGKLATYGSTVREEEKVSKLRRTLPESFSPLAMVAETSNVEFDRLITTIESELARLSTKASRQNNRSTTGAQVRSSANIATVPGSSSQQSRDIDKNASKVRWSCGRRGHFSRQCWQRADQNRGHGNGSGRRPYRGRGRGNSRGFGRGRGRGYSRGNFVPFNRDGHQQYENHNPNNVQQPPLPPAANNHQHEPNQNNNGNFYGFMAQIKFRSSVAVVDKNKTADMLIDSGGTHHFFHSISSFVQYERVHTKDVMSALGLSIIVGKGLIRTPLDKDTLVEAYHTPHFSTNILAVSKLTKNFDIVLSEGLLQKKTLAHATYISEVLGSSYCHKPS